MSSDLTLCSTLDDSPYDFYLAPPLNLSDWSDRTISWRELPEVRAEIERRIISIYHSGNEALAHQLASLYFQQLNLRHQIVPVGWVSSTWEGIKDFFQKGTELIAPLAPIAFPCTPLSLLASPIIQSAQDLNNTDPNSQLRLWKLGDLIGNPNHLVQLSSSTAAYKGLKEFWKKYKTEIIVTLVIIVVAATVITVIVVSDGGASEIAVATGAGALAEVLEECNQIKLQKGSHPKKNEAVQNFCHSIGGSNVRTENGIPIVELDPSQENSFTFFNDLARQADTFLSPLVKTDSLSLESTPFFATSDSLATPPITPQSLLETAQCTLNQGSRIDVPLLNVSASSALPQSDPTFSSSPQTNLLWETDRYLQWRQLQAIETVRPSPNPSVPPSEESRPHNHSPVKNNYASQAQNFTAGFQSPPPFAEAPLIGHSDQCTVHYHCGIGNTLEEIVEGGSCLQGTLNNDFAVKPHLIHSPSVPLGLGLVQLELSDSKYVKAEEALQQVNRSPEVPNFSGLILQSSNIQKSIDYEVENLSKIAQNIIEQNNPHLKQLHVTFSNGGYIFNEALKRLSPEHQDTIIIVTTGTTQIIDRGSAHLVYNIIGDKDNASQLCNGGVKGIEKAREKADVRLIPQTETQKWIEGHYFMQSDYQQKIAEYLKTEIINKYEIY